MKWRGRLADRPIHSRNLPNPATASSCNTGKKRN